MHHFAVCEDNPAEVEKIDALLKLYKNSHADYEFSIHHFSFTEPLLTEIETGTQFHLLLLDIYLPDKTGIEAALELRRRGFANPIIFLTTSREHMLKAFSVHAIHYLVKPFTQEDFFSALDEARDRMSLEQTRYIMIKSDKSLRRIAVKNIIYCESQNHHQRILLTDGTELLTRMTSSELFLRLSVYTDFIRCGASYIVNLEHIEALGTNILKMDNGLSVPIPRGSYSSIKKQFFDYFCTP